MISALVLMQADFNGHIARHVALPSGLVTTLAGSAALNGGPPNNYGYADGYGSAASFWSPAAVAVDGAGTFVIVVSLTNTSLPGPCLPGPYLVEPLLQADYSSHLLRRINLSSYLVTTLAGSTSGIVGLSNSGHADGVGKNASFWYPLSVAVDTPGTFAVVVSSIEGICMISDLM